jgi:hypothetical protein
MRKGLRMTALCTLLMSGVAVATEEMESSSMEAAPAATAAEGSAGGDFARMPPGADSLPAPSAPPMAEEAAVAVPDGNGTNPEAPAEDRAADQAAPSAPEGAPPAPGESAGSRI